MRLPVELGTFAVVKKNEGELLVFGGKTKNANNNDVFLIDVKSNEIEKIGEIILPGVYNSPVSSCGDICCVLEWKTLQIVLYDWI